MRELIVRLDPVAALRAAGSSGDPDPVAAATVALMAGADGIAVHLREDRAPISGRDARVLRQTLRRGFHMDIAPLPEMLKVALEVRPDAVTLVAEFPDQSSGGGLDVQTELAALGEMVRQLEDGNIRCALRVPADPEQVKAAHRIGARWVQLDTSRYCEQGPDGAEQLANLRDAARLGHKLALKVGATGGLEVRTLHPLLEVPELTQFCVGHSLASRALLVGLERAVGELRGLLD